MNLVIIRGGNLDEVLKKILGVLKMRRSGAKFKVLGARHK